MKSRHLQFLLLGLSAVTSVIMYFNLPNRIPSHWNYLGQVDGFSSKLAVLAAFPLLTLFIYSLLMLIPKFDPLNKNIKEFSVEFEKFITVMMLFFLVIQYQVILWAVGIKLSPNTLFPLIISILFYSIGGLLSKSKPNWSIGIRTPWTLSSEKVWEKTHSLGAKLFKLSPLVLLPTLLFPRAAFFVLIAYILLITATLIAYSYLQYQQTTKAKVIEMKTRPKKRKRVKRS